MGLIAMIPLENAREAEEMLRGLVAVNVLQLQNGVPPIGPALAPTGRVRYIRRDDRERWLSILRIWAKGGGDCEDLAAAYAAELIVAGIPARVIIRKARPGLWHALVERIDTGTIFDPSVWGGMLAA